MMTYLRLARVIASESLMIFAARGCACCGGGGRVGGSQNRTCPACDGTGKGATE